MICNKCWNDAYTKSYLTGRCQAECYVEFLKEREDNPCSIEEQGCQECGSSELAGTWVDDERVIKCHNCGWCWTKAPPEEHARTAD